MQSSRTIAALLLGASIALAATATGAATPVEIRANLEAQARAGTPGFGGFSTERGQRFFGATHGNDWSCASCHTANPLATGKHAKTGKEIAPLAPAANSQRFTDVAKVDKWFSRNCNDVVGRACTAQEKGDVLAYLMSLAK